MTTTTTIPSTTIPSECTATQTIPPTCEVQVGDWCAPPLPDFDNVIHCKLAAGVCALQVASCFKKAGWPEASKCFEFGGWCKKVKSYCIKDCLLEKKKGGSCSKDDFWHQNPPPAFNPPVVTTIVTPCPTTIVTQTPYPPISTTSCVPEPTNICQQPSVERYGIGGDKPVGGIHLPIVGCNDNKKDWFSKKPFKFYTDPKSDKCPSFDWPSRPDVCKEACKEQLNACLGTYAKGCKSSWKRDEVEAPGFTRRTFIDWYGGGKKGDDECASKDSKAEWLKKGSDLGKCWGKGGNDPWISEKRCKVQYAECLIANKFTKPGNSCSEWCK